MSYKRLIKSILTKFLIISNLRFCIDARSARNFLIVKIIIKIRIFELTFFFVFVVSFVSFISFIFIIIIFFSLFLLLLRSFLLFSFLFLFIINNKKMLKKSIA